MPQAPNRRSFMQHSLGGSLALLPLSSALAGQRLPTRAESPLVGVDPILIDSGLTQRWQSAMKQDLGWSARWTPLDTGEVLQQLEQGQIDAGLFLSHPKADDLDKQGLIFNRVVLAKTGVVLVGPADDMAGIRSESDPGRALAQVINASRAGAVKWQPPAPGSALGALADQLTQGLSSKSAAVAAATPPAATTTTTATATAKGRSGNSAAYRLMTLAEWAKAPPKGEKLKVWLSDPSRMHLEAQVACSFRSRHAGAKLLVSWLQWPLAQGAIKASRPGWQPMKE